MSAAPVEPPRIHIEGHDRPLFARPDQTVLQSMIQAGQSAIAVGCRGGGCGVCRIQVLSGTYRAAPMNRSRISQDDETNGIVLACRIIAESNLTINPLPLNQSKAGNRTPKLPGRSE